MQQSGTWDEVSELEQCIIDVSCAEYSSSQSFNSVLVMQFGHMISVAAIHFEDEFCTRWDRER